VLRRGTILLRQRPLLLGLAHRKANKELLGTLEETSQSLKSLRLVAAELDSVGAPLRDEERIAVVLRSSVDYFSFETARTPDCQEAFGSFVDEMRGLGVKILNLAEEIGIQVRQKCVSVTMFHRQLRLAAICHGMLPAAPGDGPAPTQGRFQYLSAAMCSTGTFGMILTGMGEDGAKGMLGMKQAGAFNLAQDEASCVVFGMPAEAIKAGGGDEILPLEAMAQAVLRYCRHESPHGRLWSRRAPPRERPFGRRVRQALNR
jgi:CheB methylesterase